MSKLSRLFTLVNLHTQMYFPQIFSNFSLPIPMVNVSLSGTNAVIPEVQLVIHWTYRNPQFEPYLHLQ